MTDNIILFELQKIHEALTKTKEVHLVNLRMINSTENFHFSEPVLRKAKLGLIRLSVCNFAFNVNRRNNQFLYACRVFDCSSLIPSSGDNVNASVAHSSKIASITNYNKGTPILYSTIRPSAYKLSDIAELIQEETESNVIIEPDKITMKCKIEIKEGALSFDVENSLASLLGFRKILYTAEKYTAQRIVDIMGFNTTNIH